MTPAPSTLTVASITALVLTLLPASPAENVTTTLPLPLEFGSLLSRFESFHEYMSGKVGEVVKWQWVRYVESFTSQYNDGGRSAKQVIGHSNRHPWAQAEGAFTRDQGITVVFSHVVLLRGVHVYETSHPGGVVEIYALDQDSKEEVLAFKTSKASDLGPNRTRKFRPKLEDAAIDTPTRQLRLVVDCTAAGTYVEIDAIQLIGAMPQKAYPALYSRRETYVDGELGDRWYAYYLMRTLKPGMQVKLTHRRPGSHQDDAGLRLGDKGVFRSFVHKLHSTKVIVDWESTGKQDWAFAMDVEIVQ